MKNLIRICIVVILSLMLSYTLQAQDHFAKLEKNRNVQAQGLLHTLNSTRDTLILKSDKRIKSLYTINMDYKRELDLRIDSTSFKLPLNKLSKGKHVMVAVQSPVQIVFVVKILKDSPENELEELITSNLVSLETTDEEVIVIDN